MFATPGMAGPTKFAEAFVAAALAAPGLVAVGALNPLTANDASAFEAKLGRLVFTGKAAINGLKPVLVLLVFTHPPALPRVLQPSEILMGL